MSAGASQTSIINAALNELGSTRRIESVNDSLGPAPSAASVWDGAVRFMLAAHPWNWSIARRMLNETATAPEFGYLYAFTLPEDSLRWLPPAHEDGDAWFEGIEEGGCVLTDTPAPLPIRYISITKGQNIAAWSPAFERALELEIAARLAEPITQDESIKDLIRVEADKALAHAKRIDGRSSGHKQRRAITQRSDWLSARRTTYGPEGR